MVPQTDSRIYFTRRFLLRQFLFVSVSFDKLKPGFHSNEIACACVRCVRKTKNARNASATQQTQAPANRKAMATMIGCLPTQAIAC